MSDAMQRLKQAIVEGDDVQAVAAAKQTLADGQPALKVVNEAVVAGIQEAGRLWRENQYFLPDVVLSAEAFNVAMAVLEPHVAAGQTHAAGKVLIGTVAGDMHNLGKAIVVAMLRGAGFDVVDLGVDVPTATFLAKTAEWKPDILGLGCYMSTTMLIIKDIIQQCQAQGLCSGLKIMVGGVPTSQEFADQVGADAWGKDALDTVTKALHLVGR
ncbi:MAG TPA: cobalamin-dependent protein [Anaerolineae bacterium]|nr:cobalamin-dependent protein [Anaerolineae bacterium]HNT05594.1 cobalamin-dependent protein [Anaerolineae bacterium]